MNIIKNEIRPVGFVTIEFTENDIQSIIGVFEQVEYLMNHTEYHKGQRKEILDLLRSIIPVTKGN